MHSSLDYVKYYNYFDKLHKFYRGAQLKFEILSPKKFMFESLATFFTNNGHTSLNIYMVFYCLQFFSLICEVFP